MSLPIILVCAIGLILVIVRALPKNTRRMAIIGLSLLTMDAFAGAGFRIYIASQAYRDDAYSGLFSIIQTSYGIVTTLLFLAGLIFLIIAICIKDPPAAEKPAEQMPYWVSASAEG